MEDTTILGARANTHLAGEWVSQTYAIQNDTRRPGKHPSRKKEESALANHLHTAPTSRASLAKKLHTAPPAPMFNVDERSVARFLFFRSFFAFLLSTQHCTWGWGGAYVSSWRGLQRQRDKNTVEFLFRRIPSFLKSFFFVGQDFLGHGRILGVPTHLPDFAYSVGRRLVYGFGLRGTVDRQPSTVLMWRPPL
jgi:hypothetical protein